MPIRPRLAVAQLTVIGAARRRSHLHAVLDAAEPRRSRRSTAAAARRGGLGSDARRGAVLRRRGPAVDVGADARAPPTTPPMVAMSLPVPPPIWRPRMPPRTPPITAPGTLYSRCGCAATGCRSTQQRCSGGPTTARTESPAPGSAARSAGGGIRTARRASGCGSFSYCLSPRGRTAPTRSGFRGPCCAASRSCRDAARRSGRGTSRRRRLPASGARPRPTTPGRQSGLLAVRDRLAGGEGAAAEVIAFVEGDLRGGMRADGDGGEAEQGLVVHGGLSLMTVTSP